MAMDGTPIIIKKKKSHEHPHHGGSWKVAYADFVTAMMAFFMVLWIMGLSDQTRAQVSGYFNDPLGFAKTQPRSQNMINFKGMENPKPGESAKKGNQTATGENSVQGYDDVMKKIEKALPMSSKSGIDLKRFINISNGKEGLRIELIEERQNVFFEVGSARLTSAAREAIGALAPQLVHLKGKMIIEGHTDSRPYDGNGYDNVDLSTDRARSIKHELQQDGVSNKLIQQVRGYGSAKLKFPFDGLNPGNRRVVIVIPSIPLESEPKVSLADGNIKEDLGPKNTPSIGPKSPSIKP